MTPPRRRSSAAPPAIRAPGARPGPRTPSILAPALAAAALLLGAPEPAAAYVGPGAGFAFVSTFFLLLVAFLLAVVTLLTWPLRWFGRAVLRGARRPSGPTRRVVVVGLDGLDPDLAEGWLAEGRLPHLARLRDAGAYRRLGTTLPAESPVAWSSFQTGCNPGKHRVFDFLVPNRRTLIPELSSAAVSAAPRPLRLGRWRLPWRRPHLRAGRRSQPFWKVLGDHGVFSSVLRVPLTFPPEPFHGVLLSAMCLPDLRGSQGTYFLYTSDADEQPALSSGLRLPLERDGDGPRGNGLHGEFVGPHNSLVADGERLRLPFQLTLHGGGRGTLTVDGVDHALSTTRDSGWIRLAFRPGLGRRVRGLCKARLLSTQPHVRLYVTPLQIDPETPALPISHPFTYAPYLARTEAPFASLGVAEDTSALNEGVIDEDAFLEQCDAIHAERETMLFDALETTRRGLVACVFDISDRVQHMFTRCLDDAHPANAGREVDRHRRVIGDLYARLDDLVGRVAARLGDGDVLLVLSDHGFKPFRRGVDLNAWLRAHGFLALRDGAATTDMLADVDWSRTTAYAVGFGGIYLNRAGREARGIVADDDVAELKARLRQGLLALVDDEDAAAGGGDAAAGAETGPGAPAGPGEGTAASARPVRAVYDRNVVWHGPYVDDAPDLFVGFAPGYRAAWPTVTGGLGKAVLSDNTRPWSGDHNMDPAAVPGVLFASCALREGDPHITDVAPTVLELLGVTPPGYMDGRSLVAGEAASTGADAGPARVRAAGTASPAGKGVDLHAS